MRILGVVLAGGQATRMGGGDKALLEIAGKSLLTLLLKRLSPQVASVILNANGDASRFKSYNLPVVQDELQGFQGPLAGILAGLNYAQAHGYTHIISVAGDTPFIPTDLVERLKAAGEVASVSSNGHTHPVIGLWPVDLTDALHSFLASNQRKIDKFTATYRCVYVEFDAKNYDPFFNINTKEELEIATELYKSIFH